MLISVYMENGKTHSEYSEKIVNEIQKQNDESPNEFEQETDEELRKFLNPITYKNEKKKYQSGGHEIRIRGDIIYLFKDGIYRVRVSKHKIQEIIWNYHRQWDIQE